MSVQCQILDTVLYDLLVNYFGFFISNGLILYTYFPSLHAFEMCVCLFFLFRVKHPSEDNANKHQRQEINISGKPQVHHRSFF